MIELTPLDVRKKRGDFRRAMRGFDPQEVDAFLELVAERMESLVKENMTLKERSARLADQVREQQVREKAVQDALVTAQELRKDISGQAQREAELIKREAEAEIERMLLDAENRADSLQSAMAELERRRRRFIKSYQQMLEREMDSLEVEAARHPLEERPLELDLSGAVANATATADRGHDTADREGPDDDSGHGPAAGAEPVAEPETAIAEPVEPLGAADSADGAEAVSVDAVSVDALAPEESQPTAEQIRDADHVPLGEEWGSVRPRLRTEASGERTDNDGI